MNAYGDELNYVCCSANLVHDVFYLELWRYSSLGLGLSSQEKWNMTYQYKRNNIHSCINRKA